MAKLKLTGKELRKIGYPEGPVISLAMNIMEKSFKHLSKEDALEILGSILQSPNQYAHDGVLNRIAEALLPKAPPSEGFGEVIELAEKGIDVNIQSLLRDIQDRDRRDAARANAPLRPAADAEVLDTTNMTIEAAVAALLARIRAAGL